MKSPYVSLVCIVAVLAASVSTVVLQGPQSDCPDICTFDYRPICGYDGSCYHIYGNECTLKSERCKKKQALQSVEMKLCDEAMTKRNSDFVACPLE